MTFWDNLPKPFFVLAPMEDVTDIVFRHVVARAARPDVFMTEFTNTASYCSEKGNFSTRGRLEHDSSEQPIVAQIWGTNPDNFATMAAGLASQDFAGIDINMGCPAKDVVKIGAGSGLIRQPDTAIKIIQATKQAGLPVSVKTRLGFSRVNEYLTWLPTLLQQDVANLTIHLRTRREMSKVNAHYELIPEILALRDRISPQTKITINGDVQDYAQAIKLFNDYPGIDGFMIGRGIFRNPYCFDHCNKTPSQSELLELFRYHLDQYDKYRQIMPNERPELVRNFDSLKHFFKIYIKDFPGAADLRTELYSCVTTNQIRDTLNNWFTK